MTESLLHYLWKFRLFNNQGLQTKSGEPIEVLHPGIHNTNSGPDFFNAKIKIGNKTWAGNIEIHVDGKDWYTHRHHKDAAYKNVILHVVLHTSSTYVECLENTTIPCVELQNNIAQNLLAQYQNLMDNQLPFPCAASVANTNELIKKNMLERASIERLESKINHIERLLKNSNGNWEQVCWQLMARYLGSGIHGDALEQTATQIPLKIIAKHYGNTTQIEALIFGVAGLLQETFTDDYPILLKREFNYLKQLHQLPTLNAGIFKWAKTRPANFPTIRLAQLAALANAAQSLFSKLLESNIHFLTPFLHSLDVNTYWKTHFRFNEAAENKFTRIGKNTQQILAVNAVAPLLFAYGKNTGNELMVEKSLDILRQFPPEKNATTNLYKQYGFTAESALDTQGILQLNHTYCLPKKCLNCSIGNHIMQS
ncbi:MAG: DUF2851 family protein [Chitinophagales bacterium]|nr:DUF2851 family protein [Chitinophagales bacterium]